MHRSFDLILALMLVWRGNRFEYFFRDDFSRKLLYRTELDGFQDKSSWHEAFFLHFSHISLKMWYKYYR